MYRCEKPLGRVLSLFLNLIILNLLFTICALPIVTSGAAAIALYEQQYAIWERREQLLVCSYLKAFWKNMIKGFSLFGISLLIVIVGIGLCLLLYFLGLPVYLCIISVVIPVGSVFIWLIGLTGRFNQGVIINFRNAIFLAFANPLASLLLVLTYFAYPILFFFIPENMFSSYLFILLFLYQGASSWLSAGVLLKTLNEIQQSQAEP